MSDNPIQKKLQIKPDQIIAIISPPSGYLESLGKLPAGVRVDSELVDSYDIIHGFFLLNIKPWKTRSETLNPP